MKHDPDNLGDRCPTKVEPHVDGYEALIRIVA